MQKLIGNKPYKWVTDKNETQMKPDEGTYIKNFRLLFNKNQNKGGAEKRECLGLRRSGETAEIINSCLQFHREINSLNASL